MVKLTKIQADRIRGVYKDKHSCEPVEIAKGVYILHDEMMEVPEIKKKLNFTVTKLSEIKGSEDDIIYNKYLSDNSKLTTIKG